MKNTKHVILKLFKEEDCELYFIESISSYNLFPLAKFLTEDYLAFKDFYWSEYFDKEIEIDSGGNSTWIEEKNSSITVTFQFGKNEEYTTTKEKFFKIIKQWDKVVAKKPPKIIIKEIDGEIIISPLEQYMN